MPRPSTEPTPVTPEEAGAAASAPERILDAAEALFAREGYFAATIRSITELAGVPLGLARYHFGSKDQLFQQVLARRAAETCTQLEGSLQRALEATPSTQSRLEAVVGAMISLSAERLASGDIGWRHYLQLLSHLNQLTDYPELLKPFSSRYSLTVAAYRQALRGALPEARDTTIDWALHFMQMMAGHAMQDLAVTRSVAGASHVDTEWDELREQLVTHLVGGIRAQVALHGHSTGRTNKAAAKPPARPG